MDEALTQEMRQALRDGFDALILQSERFEKALEEIATGRSGQGPKIDLEVCRTIALRALKRI